MTAVERVAAFLKDRDENVLPSECDDAERMESAKEIMRLLFDGDGNIKFADLLMAGDREITLQMTPAKRPAGVCRACGATVTEKGKPLTGRYCSRACIEAGPSRPTVDMKVVLS